VNKTSIGFFLPEAAEATCQFLTKRAGWCTSRKASLPKGENTIVLDRALLNTTGMLYYKLETATDSDTKKMVQAK
jgi:hypothetical protein